MLIYMIISITLSVEFVHADSYLELADHDFETEIGKHALTLVKFYAPWCGHCVKLAQPFADAAAILAADDYPVQLMKVDCTVHMTVCRQQKINGYPILKMFKGDIDISEKYEGPREKDAIVEHMRSLAGPTSTLLETVADVEKFIGGENPVIVCFLSSEKSKIQKVFIHTANALSEAFTFGYTSNTEAIARFGFSDEIIIHQPKYLHNKFESFDLKYTGNVEYRSLKKFIEENIHGLVGHLTSKNSAQFKNPLVTAWFNVDFEKNVKKTTYWRNRILKVAKDIKATREKLNFAISSRYESGDILEQFDLVRNDDKPVVIAENLKGRAFIMSDEFSVENLEKFCYDFLDGELEPHPKSAPVPPSNDGAVKIVVGKNFKDIVADDKDVLLEFYTTWCGHCKQLAPKYYELGKKLKNVKTLVIAAMDAESNDVPKPYVVQGFPTIYFKPAFGEPKEYSGFREVKNFISYLKEEAKLGLEGYVKKGKKKSIKTEL